jgi:hypothetical protein
MIAYTVLRVKRRAPRVRTKTRMPAGGRLAGRTESPWEWRSLGNGFPSAFRHPRAPPPSDTSPGPGSAGHESAGHESAQHRPSPPGRKRGEVEVIGAQSNPRSSRGYSH